MSATERPATMEEVFTRLGLPVQANDRRDTVRSKLNQGQRLPPTQNDRMLSSPGLTPAGRSNYVARRKVVFQIPGGFTFSLPFLGAVLSGCRRYLILSLEESESDTFKLAGNSETPAQTGVKIPEISVDVTTENSDKSFEYVIDGIKYFVFPVVRDLSPIGGPEEDHVREEYETEDEAEQSLEVPVDGEDEAQDLDSPADAQDESGYTNPAYDILFGPK